MLSSKAEQVIFKLKWDKTSGCKMPNVPIETNLLSECVIITSAHLPVKYKLSKV